MEDAQPTANPSTGSGQALPDDPAALKLIIATISRQRDEAQLKAQELEVQKLRLEVELLRLKKWHYGPRADKLDIGQLLLEFAVALEQKPVNAHDLPPGSGSSGTVDVAVASRRVKPGRRNISALDKLPVVRHVHELAEDHQPCPCCGKVREKIGQETTWQIEHFPGHFARIEHVQVKYACKHCEQNADSPQITLAEKPLQPIDKGMAGPGLLAYVITSKFADHMPLYRQESVFARNGFEIDRSTMSLWAGDVADLVKPLYQRMIDRVLLSHVIGTDDTVMPMLAAAKTRQARMWVYLGDDDHPYNVFDFTLSRSRDGPAAFLKNYNQVLLADAYGGYEGVCIEKQIVQAGCWSHARRKFVDTQTLSPAIAAEALGSIGGLFAIEQQARQRPCADRLALRQVQSRPVMERLHGKLLEWKQQLLPKHPMAEAIGYVLNQWQPLTAFLSDGAIPIHNMMASYCTS